MPIKQINHQSPLDSSPILKTCPVVHGYPLVGLLPELIFTDRIQVLQQVAKQHPGEVVALKIGPIQAYLVTHPDHVQYVLNDNWQNFGKGKVVWNAARRAVGDNIVTNDGESWFRSRRLMQPVFTASQINSLTELIIKFIGESLSHLDAGLHREAVYIDKEMMLLGQSIMLGTMFSSSLDLSQHRSIADALDIIVRECSRRAFLSFLPKWFPIQGETTLRTALRIIDDTILSIIRERRKSGEDHKDLLSRLLEARDTETNTGMSDKQLRDECVVSFLAGFETTSSSLTWLWYMLNQHPEVENQMRAEIDAVVGKRQPTSADIANLQYTKMVIQEVLRQHPVFWLMPRIANTDDVIGGYPIKAGSAILLSPYLTNYLPEFWERPEDFDPERFAPERSNNRHPYAQFTFGGGPRLCLGKHLALMQMQLIVVMMMQKYRLRPVPGHPVEIVPSITLRLRHGLKMTLEPVS